MTIQDINTFISVIGEGTPFMLICDNAYEFEMNKEHNWLFFDGTANKIHSLCNNNSTLINTDRAAQYTTFSPDMVQYCQAILNKNELASVVESLKLSGLITEEVKAAIELDKALINVRDRKDLSIPEDGINKLS
jgi:hypothetical protein